LLGALGTACAAPRLAAEYNPPVTLFREKLRRGEVPLGAIVQFTDPAITEALCQDLDFIWIDHEHGGMTLPIVSNHILATKGTRATPIVRVAANDPAVIKPVLDMGAEGIVVPLIRTVEDAKMAVAACKYPPQGVRGYGPRRPSDYGRLGGADFVKKMNDWTMVILQIEEIDAVNNIDKILQVPGITSLVIGSNDLSGTMGLLGQPRHPRVLQAIETVIAAARRAHVWVGIGVPNDPAVITEWISKGMQWVSMGNDAALMLGGLNEVSSKVRGFLQQRGKSEAATGGVR
jgi:2-keto-3-deoxy-L-rhamnonate aldolase RhmA